MLSLLQARRGPVRIRFQGCTKKVQKRRPYAVSAARDVSSVGSPRPTNQCTTCGEFRGPDLFRQTEDSLGDVRTRTQNNHTACQHSYSSLFTDRIPRKPQRHYRRAANHSSPQILDERCTHPLTPFILASAQPDLLSSHELKFSVVLEVLVERPSTGVVNV